MSERCPLCQCKLESGYHEPHCAMRKSARKRVKQIEIRVTLEDGRVGEAVWIREEKIAEILLSGDAFGDFVIALVQQIPDAEVPS